MKSGSEWFKIISIQMFFLIGGSGFVSCEYFSVSRHSAKMVPICQLEHRWILLIPSYLLARQSSRQYKIKMFKAGV